VAVSPIASTALTGFTLTLDGTGTFSTSTQVTGKVYAASYASPTPSTLTTAISDLVTAYNDASGRVNPNYTDLGAGKPCFNILLKVVLTLLRPFRFDWRCNSYPGSIQVEHRIEHSVLYHHLRQCNGQYDLFSLCSLRNINWALSQHGFSR
jgi:hypothetical protein